MKKTLGQRIRELRDEKDFSLRELAHKLGGISAAHISDIELGRRYPSDELLKKIADKLGTTVDDLRSYDSRAPLEDLKRMSESDATFGFALRKLLDKDVTAEEIIKWADKKPDRKKK